MKNKLISLLIISFLFLSGCSAINMAEQRYPKRIQYSFFDKTTGLTNVYFCKNIDGREKTDIRAKTAHTYLSKRISEVTNKSMEKLFEDEKFSLWSAMKMSASLQGGAKLVAKEVEDKYKCTLVDTIDD